MEICNFTALSYIFPRGISPLYTCPFCFTFSLPLFHHHLSICCADGGFCVGPLQSNDRWRCYHQVKAGKRSPDSSEWMFLLRVVFILYYLLQSDFRNFKAVNQPGDKIFCWCSQCSVWPDNLREVWLCSVFFLLSRYLITTNY